MKYLVKTVIYVFVILGFFLVIPQLRAQVTVSASVDRNDVSLEDEIYLTVEVKGARKATEPVLPSMPGFKIIPSGTTSSIQNINGVVEAKKQYSYILIPQEEGGFTINPISVFLDGREYRSQPINIEVAKSGYVSPSPGIDPPPSGQAQADSFGQPTQQATQPYWITASVSNPDPYINEQILYTFRFFTRINVGRATLTLPEFEDFWSEEVVPEKKYYQTIQGRKYVVSEKVVALYPLKTGEVTIPETVLRIEVAENARRRFFDDPFFRMGSSRSRPKYLRAKPVVLNVQSLPEGKPDNFTNLVGQFGLSVNLSDSEVTMGESTTMSIELSGTGNIKDAILPTQLKLPSFKTYQDKPVTDTVKSQKGIQGTKSFKRALVPTQSGEFSIPSFTVSYFNPSTERYESLESPSLSVRVLPASEETLNPVIAIGDKTDGRSTSIMAEDIATIHTNLASIQSQKWGYGIKGIFIAGLFLPPFLFFGTLLLQKRQAHREEYAGIYKSRLAYRNFKKELHRTGRLPENQALNQLLENIRDYIGDRCEVFGKALTIADMAAQLESRGVGKDLTGQLRDTIHQLEYARYGGEKIQKSSSSWFKDVSHLIHRIDKKIKNKQK